MDVVTRSRFSTAPIISSFTGKPQTPKIGERDAHLFYALERHYHYLSPTYYGPIIGASRESASHRLRELRKYGYIRHAPEITTNKNNHHWGYLFYANDTKAKNLLVERGVEPLRRPAPANLQHQTMIDMVMGSIEIGVRESTALELTWWEDILPNCPDATQSSKEPWALSTLDHTYKADGLPFVITRHGEKTEHMFFLMEADCSTEPIRATDGGRSSIKRKFTDLIYIIKEGIYKQHFGANTFFVIFVFRTKRRMQSAMKLWEEMTENRQSLRKCVLFKKHPTIFDSEDKPRATGHMCTEPLYRVQYPSIILNPGVENGLEARKVA